jgi:hypothetical protein
MNREFWKKVFFISSIGIGGYLTGTYSERKKFLEILTKNDDEQEQIHSVFKVKKQYLKEKLYNFNTDVI